MSLRFALLRAKSAKERESEHPWSGFPGFHGALRTPVEANPQVQQHRVLIAGAGLS